MVGIVPRVDDDPVYGAVGQDANTLEHAKARIRFWLDPELFDDDWAEDAIVGCLLLLRATAADAEPDAEAVSSVIDRADGDRWVWDSLQEFAGSRLLRRQPLGNALRRWAGEVLRGDRTPPRKPRGAPATTTARNHLIVKALKILRDECGLTLTRNDASEAVSACDVVVAVLAEYGLHLSYKRVAEIWSKQPEGGYMPVELELL